MSGTVLLGVSLGLLSSVLFNVSYLIQHKALDGEGPSLEFTTAPLRSIRELLTHPLWMLGGILGLVGMAVYLVALAFAPISLVQAFLAGGLILTVPLSAMISQHRPTKRELTGAALMTGALVLFAFGTGAEGATNDFGDLGMAVLVGGVCVGSLLASRRGQSRGPVELVGVASGLLHGAADALQNGLVGIAKSSVVALFTSVWTYACIAVSVAAFVLLQQAFKDGQEKPVGVIALMTASTNVTAIGAGILIFHDPLGTTPFWKVVHVLAFLLVLASGWLLSTAQAALEEGPAALKAASP